MRILVTGAGGFAGRHLLNDLSAAGHTPIWFDLESPESALPFESQSGDLRNPADLDRTLLETKPDACVHLGGIAFVPMGWTHPNLVFSVNLGGTINLLESFRRHASGARILVVTSAEIYGRYEDGPSIREDTEMRPATIYAVAKMAADLASLLYARKYDMPVLTARPGNHMGPGQSDPFVTASFAKQLAEMKAGRRDPALHVGNLDSERDFSDVRDTVRAYRLLVESGTPGRAYNIASSSRMRIGNMLQELCNLADVHPAIHVDPDRFRPTDRPALLDITRIRTDVGWKPAISLSQTLADIMEDWIMRTSRNTQTAK